MGKMLDKEMALAVGKRVRRFRDKSLNMTREKFAEHVNLSTSFISDVEHGRRGLSAESIAKICKACNISADYIVLGKEQYSDYTTPIDEMLKEIPSEYNEALQDIIKGFVKAVIKNSDKLK